jgi:hypothetical protein
VSALQSSIRAASGNCSKSRLDALIQLIGLVSLAMQVYVVIFDNACQAVSRVLPRSRMDCQARRR